MAKIGNFVGQGWLRISKTEASQIAAHLQEQCRRVFGKDYFSHFEVEVDNKAWDYSTTGKRYAHVRQMTLRAVVARPIAEYRNGRGGRIKGHKAVVFKIIKHSAGWLDVRNVKTGELERDYDNCPPYLWSATVLGDGHEIVYRGREENVIQPRECYQYGTELSDLDFIQTLYDLRSMTKPYGVSKAA